MTSYFIFSYLGNKRTEYKELKPHLKLNNIKNIIEPFCGSSAIAFNIWLEYGNKFNYYLNDNSRELIDTYNIIKTEEPEDILKKLNEVKSRIKNKEDFNKIYKDPNKNIYEIITIRKVSSFRVGLFDINRYNPDNQFKLTPTQLKFFEFVKSPNVFITFNDWFKIFDEYKEDEKSVFILDPPYMASYNDFYESKTINVYEYFYNNDLNNFKSKIILMLEDIWIIKLLFKNKKVISVYGKRYEITKNKTSHIIISN
jgi:site-specific DNA-adenine methylase